MYNRVVDHALALFRDIAHEIVWCSMATTDRRNRPRSRLVHPVWEDGADGTLTGWLTTRPTPLKLAHLEHSPYVSCSYWSPAHDVAVAECAAAWGDERERGHVWDLVRGLDPPVGFDPAPMYAGGVDAPDYAVLRLTPWRTRSARAVDLAKGAAHAVWRRAGTAS